MNDNLREQLATKKAELETARLEQARPAELAKEVAELEARVERAERDRRLNENARRQQEIVAQGQEDVERFKNIFEDATMRLRNAAYLSEQIENKRTLLTQILAEGERLRGNQMMGASYPSDALFALRNRVNALINPWSGLDGKDSAKLLQLLQRWAAATAGPRPETYRLPDDVLGPAPASEPEIEKPEPANRGAIESVIRKFLNRSG